MHLSALAAGASGRLAPDLGREGIYGRSLGQHVTYRPVRAEHQIIVSQLAADAHCDGYLPLALMQRPRYEPLKKKPVEMVLEAADDNHLTEQVSQTVVVIGCGGKGKRRDLADIARCFD